MEFIQQHFIIIWILLGLIPSIILQIVEPSSDNKYKQIALVLILTLFGWITFVAFVGVGLLILLRELIDY